MRRRAAARLLLVQSLHAAFYLAKDLDHGDLGWLVAGHLHRAATALGEPVWGGVAEFVRGHAEHPFRGVALLAWRVEVRQQHLVDDLFVGIELGGSGRR